VSDKNNKYSIGTLVACAYDYGSIFPYDIFGIKILDERKWYGIVISFDPCQHDGFGHWEDFYTVLCFDSIKRDFTFNEITKIPRP
jgi:hypothetical protein